MTTGRSQPRPLDTAPVPPNWQALCPWPTPGPVTRVRTHGYVSGYHTLREKGPAACGSHANVPDPMQECLIPCKVPSDLAA